MKFNISYPLTGAQKCIEIDDEKKFSVFYDKRIGQEVEADTLGDEFKGYVLKVTGGNDKDGFTMKQGVLVKGRVRLLMSEGMSCFRARRTGHKKRKSVRGCIVGSDISVLSVSISKKGEKDIPSLTDTNIPRRLGPKRASKVKKLFAIKDKNAAELIKKNIIRRKYTDKKGKERQKAPRIQRLITASRLIRKKSRKVNLKKRWADQKSALEAYHKTVNDWRKELQRRQQQRKDAKDKKTQEKAAGATSAPAQQTKGKAAQPKTTQAKTQQPAATQKKDTKQQTQTKKK